MVVLELIRHCQSAQLETAPTKHRERKCLFIFMIHYNWFTSPLMNQCLKYMIDYLVPQFFIDGDSYGSGEVHTSGRCRMSRLKHLPSNARRY